MSNRLSRDQRIDHACKALLRAGWSVVSRHNHPRLRAPDGKLTITVPFNKSDGRATLNWFSQIRRAGVDLQAVMA
jgi:predicted RNA binding protein YcfA (HicA-like mRNA interferase family)